MASRPYAKIRGEAPPLIRVRASSWTFNAYRAYQVFPTFIPSHGNTYSGWVPYYSYIPQPTSGSLIRLFGPRGSYPNRSGSTRLSGLRNRHAVIGWLSKRAKTAEWTCETFDPRLALSRPAASSSEKRRKLSQSSLLREFRMQLICRKAVLYGTIADACSLTFPLSSIVMLLGVRCTNTKPKFLAADTSAFSSGDCAWYSNLPVGGHGVITKN